MRNPFNITHFIVGFAFGAAVVLGFIWLGMTAVIREQEAQDGMRATRCSEAIARHERAGDPLPSWASTRYCDIGD